MSRRTLYKHLKHGGFLVDAEIWVLSENKALCYISIKLKKSRDKYS